MDKDWMRNHKNVVFCLSQRLPLRIFVLLLRVAAIVHYSLPSAFDYMGMKVKIDYLLKLKIVAVVVLCVALLHSCVGKEPEKSIITVSILPQKYFLEQIVGDKFVVSCMLNEGNNPEAYEPSMTHLINIEKSKAYFCIGYIGFEYAIVGKARANNPDLKIYNNSKGIEVLRGTHGVPGDEEVDPHVWSSVRNAMQIVQNMYEAVVELDPKNEKTYTENYNRLKSNLESLDKKFANMLEPKRGSAFLVWHPSLSYFANDYGLRQISIEYEGKEVPINMLKEKIDTAKASGAKVLFIQQEFDSSQAETLNEEIGAKIVRINPMNYNWVEEMEDIANAIANN